MAFNTEPKSWTASVAQFSELKKAQRTKLMALPPDDAQAIVDGILHPGLWRIENLQQLAWPGDWADDEKGG
ncbi:MAG: hypothetical protein HY000_05500 [Planctomycetes bacterium]|nr:hypothetical protein [Planctomycetota bacterium]